MRCRDGIPAILRPKEQQFGTRSGSFKFQRWLDNEEIVLAANGCKRAFCAPMSILRCRRSSPCCPFFAAVLPDAVREESLKDLFRSSPPSLSF